MSVAPSPVRRSVARPLSVSVGKVFFLVEKVQIFEFGTKVFEGDDQSSVGGLRFGVGFDLKTYVVGKNVVAAHDDVVNPVVTILVRSFDARDGNVFEGFSQYRTDYVTEFSDRFQIDLGVPFGVGVSEVLGNETGVMA